MIWLVRVLLFIMFGVLEVFYCRVWIDDTTGNDEWI